MANLVYNMYMHMIQTSQKYRQVKKKKKNIDEYRNAECQKHAAVQYCHCLIVMSTQNCLRCIIEVRFFYYDLHDTSTLSLSVTLLKPWNLNIVSYSLFLVFFSFKL